ncbi:MAG TPA: response regulator transcription factor [Terriglobales bacterium]|nr:response regulator transcription factor [Terriglobales bacterium]
MKILLAEDDVSLGKFVCKGLEAEQHQIFLSHSGDEVEYLLENQEYDLLILDLNLPRVDGVQILRRLRANKNSLPVLILTARNKVEDRVTLLDLGADDYLVKPFSFSELSARVRALLRRRSRPLTPTLRVADLELNRVERRVTRAGKEIELSPKEFALLEYLMVNTSRKVTRTMILEHVWHHSFDTNTNVVDVYINYLRKKIDGESPVKLIRTVRGIGYVLADNSESSADSANSAQLKTDIAG